MTAVRAERPGDVECVRTVNLAGFPTSEEADLVDALRAAGHLSVSLVAEDEGQVIGHVAFSPVTSESGAIGVGLAPVAVLPSHRRRGIASQLIEAGLAACRHLGFGWVVVLGDPAFYSRFGFGAASACGLRDEYGGGAAFQVLELVEGSRPEGGGLVRYAGEFAPFEQRSVPQAHPAGEPPLL